MNINSNKLKMMRQFLLWTFGLCSICSFVYGQNPLPIGQWRSHLPYQSGQYVTQSADKIYFSTELAVVSVDKTDFAVDFLSTVNGLSNAGVEFIRYNSFSNILVVVYQNAIIDLVYEDGEVVTLNQIRNFQNFSGEKRINDMHVLNDSIVYLAATYGVSELDILNAEFRSTTLTGVEANSVHIFGDDLYAATEEGIYRISTNNVNPDDFGNWSLLGPAEGFPMDYSAQGFETFEGGLYVGVNDTAFRYENEQLEYFYAEAGSTLQFMSNEGELLLVGFRPGRVVYLHPDGRTGPLPFNCIFTPNYAIEDEKGRLWFGNEAVQSDFRYLAGFEQGFCESISFNSPRSEAVWDMSIANGQLWMASGGLDQTLSPIFIPDGFASLIDGQWAIYNRDLREALKGDDLNNSDDDIQVFVTSAIHPENGKVYMGSYIEGLVEIDPVTDVISTYNVENSSLQVAQQDIRVRVGGLAFDEDANLWVGNNSATAPISVLMPGGEWQSFQPSCGRNAVMDIAIDGSGYKWMRLGTNSAGLLLFDEGDMEDPNDDRCRVFTSNNSELPNNDVNCVVADTEGDIWVGTTEGVVIFECGSSAFDESCLGTRRIVEQDGFGARLLETENVIDIAVDGANRKWIGTQNGVFLLSPSGEEQVDRFTAANSPLFDNSIVDIAIDQEIGEIFIGTAKGVISYQSDAVEGGRVHSSDILVYPNPVREDYEGPIAIKGLARDAVVKITDISGKLVFETNALGGQAIWNGRDYNGRRVQTGVYLVFSSSNARNTSLNAQPDAAVAKIMVIN
jgi:ligand-binding sensor domain-containing protein